MASTAALTQEQFLSRCTAVLPMCDFSVTEYKNIRSEVEVNCYIHGKFIARPVHLLQGKGCKICDRLAGVNLRAHLTLEQYKEVATVLHNNKYDYTNIFELTDKIEIVCPEHGLFNTRRSAHISPTQMYGCQQCGNVRSLGEERIINFFKINNIDYTYQKTFDWAKSINNKQPLRYDFYIPSKNMLIEFDGKHHFEPTRYGGQTIEEAVAQTKRTKFYDSIKTINAKLAGMQMIRIAYTRLKDIDAILTAEMINEDNNFLRIYK